MSKQNQLHNRLNDLFADMGEEESTTQPAEIADNGREISGWNWQCDAVGYYTNCSPEVETILGVEATTFKGKLFTTFRLSAKCFLKESSGKPRNWQWKNS